MTYRALSPGQDYASRLQTLIMRAEFGRWEYAIALPDGALAGGYGYTSQLQAAQALTLHLGVIAHEYSPARPGAPDARPDEPRDSHNLEAWGLD